MSDIFEASREGDLERVKKLIDFSRENIDKKTDDFMVTPLIKSIIYGHMHVVTFLLENGADVNAEDANKYTALIHAIQRGDISMVRVLLEKGAKIKTKDSHGWTPIMHAVGGKVDFIEFLIDNGADYTTADDRGLTPLRYATEIQNADAIRILTQRGAKE